MEIGTLGILIAIIGILVGIIVSIATIVHARNRRLRGLYDIMWKSASSLKPQQVMGIRANPDVGYRDYYYKRPEARLIEQRIREGKHVLVIGNPLAGKTRAVFEVLRSLKKRHDVIIPKLVDINAPDIDIPRRLTFWRKRILLLDDLDKFFAKQNFQVLFDKLRQDKDVLVVATCRSGQEYETLCAKNEREVEVFGKPVEIPKIDKEQGEKIAADAGQEIPEKFDGNIGSIFLPLKTMRERYKTMGNPEKAILRSLRRLYMAWIFAGRQIFEVEKVKRVCQKIEGIEKQQQYIWNGLLKTLSDNGFIEQHNGNLQVEEAYLEFIVEEVGDNLENLRVLFEIFKDDPDATFKIGNRSYEIGEIDLRKKDFKRLAIDAYTESLKSYSLNESPAAYARVQNNLGSAYGRLAEVEEKADNCRRAIAAYTEALKVYTYADFPIDYAMTQNNLGSTYGALAEMEGTAENCRRAIAAFNNALKVRTLEDIPIQYGTIQNNLGNAYRTLAEVEDKADNCRQAIAACNEALKFRTFKDFPILYASTQNNLGNAYRTLAEVEKTVDNCQRAIATYNKALKVRTLSDFPMDYAMTQNNLGIAHRILAEVEDKTGNCQRAIAAHKEALRVYTLVDFPMDYAMTQTNLGTAHRTLGEVDEKADNCRCAIATYKEALKVYIYLDFPIQFGVTQNNLGNAYLSLGDVSEKVTNCGRAIAAFHESLKVRTPADFPIQYANTQNNLGNAYWTLAEVEEKAGNCNKANHAYKEAFKIYAQEKLPLQQDMVIKNLKRLAAFCEEE